MTQRRSVVVVSVEHGGNDVPPAYAHLFRGAEGDLASHRGWDPGALEMATSLATAWRASLLAATVSRLVVDLNRSAHHRKVFSDFTRVLDSVEREQLLESWHAPHRAAVQAAVRSKVDQGNRVIHLGVHSFTPVLHGVRRTADVALLYDPSRSEEKALASAWAGRLRRALPDLAIRRNSPYCGASDGLTTSLRRVFADAEYCGLEIEVNQRLIEGNGHVPTRITKSIAVTLLDVLDLDQ